MITEQELRITMQRVRDVLVTTLPPYPIASMARLGNSCRSRREERRNYINANETLNYGYDRAWNMLHRTNNYGILGLNLDVDTKNEITNTDLNGPLTCDANGNMATRDLDWGSGWTTYCYDDENRLISWTYTATGANGSPNCGDPPSSTSDLQSQFVYDGLGRLRERLEYVPDGSGSTWVLSSETEYIYDGNRVLQERDGSNNPLVSYTRGPDLSGSLEGAGGIGGLLARSASGHSYYHADGNGNITCLIATNQSVVASYSYDPYGNVLSSSGALANANVYRFSSKECHVNSGMYCYLYRFYDPSLQRWPNRDPINERGFMRLTTTKGGDAEDDFNLYTFVQNKPTYKADNYGLSIWYCTRTTDWGIGRHGYLWDDRTNPKGGHSCGQEGAWGFGDTSSPTDTGPGTKDGDTSCTKVPDSDGNESWIMNYCRKHINDQKLWWPGNDCHTAANRILDDLGFQPPPIQRWNPGEQMFWQYMHTGIYGPL